MSKKNTPHDDQQSLPMEIPTPPDVIDQRFKSTAPALWSQSKAMLVQRYLLYFTYITKHGTYIDGFAGPQDMEHFDLSCAKLVIENEPRWIRHFYLFDIKKNKIKILKKLRMNQPTLDRNGKKIVRCINIEHGDFNQLIHDLLATKCISQKEATFCLLDQRTFECKWSTIKALARYKTTGNNKFELILFFT